MENTISAVIPLYNRQDLIIDTLSSIEKQLLKPCEVIVVNDRSSDASVERVQDYAKHSTLNIVLIENTRKKGTSGAKNCGIAQAKGKFIALLDSDDLWTPVHLQQLENMLNKHSEASIAFSAVKFFGDASDVEKLEKRFDLSIERCLRESFYRDKENFWISNKKLLWNLLNFGVSFRCPASLIKKNLFIENGLIFDENIEFTEDAQFITMAAYFSPVLYSENIGLLIRRHPGNDGDVAYHSKLEKCYESRARKLKLFFSDKNLDRAAKKALKYRLAELYLDAVYLQCEHRPLLMKVMNGLSVFLKIPCSKTFIAWCKLILKGEK